MTRDTYKVDGGRMTKRGGGPDRPRRPGRLAARVRAVCLLLCVALALQPSLLVPGRAASSRTRTAVGPQNSLADFTAHLLLAVVTSIASALRPSAPVPAVVGIPPVTLVSAYEPEPAAALVFLSAPASLSVDSTADATVQLSWPAVTGAVGYRVERSPNLLTPYSPVGDTASNGFPDGGLARGSTYLYRVRAIDSTGSLSAPSAVGMATAITFTDPELIGANDSLGRPATVVKADHLNDLRTAVAGVRRAAALPAATWAEAVSSGTPVRADHVRELRQRLDEALQALGLTHPAYTDTTLYTGRGGTPIKKKHFEELRSYSTRGSGVTGSGLTAYDFASARLDPSNRTGGGGVDLLSRNFNWSLPLVSLPGRAGLDLGLSLTYNSLVWTKSGGYALFDGDWGWPAPGFRLGFAVVQGRFYDTQAQKYAYLLVTPSGSRVSLRQTASAGVYEAGDSSYLQLTEESDGTLTVRTTDGTRMSYQPLGGLYKCAEIKDRQGNFITVTYNTYGNVQTVTDTLGRAINFSYYADGYLDEITQTWHREVEGGSTVTETHRWAKFYYADKAVRTNFTGLTVFGPTGGQTFRALTKVQLSDNSAYTFNYTTWGQVNQVAAYAPDTRLLNYTTLDLPADETVAQADCPRPTQRRDWAAYWNGDEDGAGAAQEEAVTAYGPYNFAGGVAKATAPDGTLHQESYETVGWKRGLTTRADEYSADDLIHRKKWTVLQWTQDDESLAYPQNPRVRETNVYDSKDDGSGQVRDRRRTEITYIFWGLPEDVKEYDADGVTVLRRTHMEYKASSVNGDGAYALRRIIGLPEKREVYGLEGGQEKLFSKVTFDYDEANGAVQYLADAGAVAQHDGAGYGASFNTRGNVCRTRRWDATDPLNQSKSVASEAGYDTLGSALFTTDAAGHKTKVYYEDSDGGARLAYPTKVTDPDNFSSTVEYNYDLGVPTRAVDPKGAAVKTFYDSAGRVQKTKSEDEVNGAYASFEYGTSGLYTKRLTKVDATKPETFVMSVTDGVGRTLGALRDHPGEGSTGYAASRTEYDVMGKAVKQYNPAEVSVDAADQSNARAWVPAGDDSNPQGRAGWAHTSTVYDWKGRPKVSTNADGTSAEAEYGGCGCAGGEVVTVTDEGTLSADGTLRRRRSRTTSDVLSRPVKSETFNWDGTVYTTAVTEYNALNQVEHVKVYQGAETSDGSCPVATCQLTTEGYDGHGRLKSSQGPAQTRAVTYQYKDDDALWKVLTPRETDGTSAQDVTATFTYNSRHMVTRVEYAVPGGLTNVPATDPVEFGYDSAGNRLWMTDGSGRTDYQYDTLSRLQSETRQFAGLAGSYTLSYAYNLAGQLKGITEGGATIEYKYDRAGRTEEVNGQGTLYAGVSSYASAVRYRAWGAVKFLNYGNTGSSLNLSVKYNSRLLPEEFTVGNKPPIFLIREAIHKKYSYNPDGSLSFSDDQIDDNFDRLMTYDHASRLATAIAGYTASMTAKGAPGNALHDPYAQTYGYDTWGNLTSRQGVYWDQGEGAESYTASYDSRGRLPDTPYDAAGNALQGPEGSYKFDASGRNQEVLSGGVYYTQTRDGDGAVAKRTTSGASPSASNTTYYLKSSALGGSIVSELSSAGVRQKGYVYAGGEVLAEQEGGHVRWWHGDPHGGSFQKWDENHAMTEQAENDPTGVDVGASNPYENTGGDPDLTGEGVSLVPDDPSGRCRVDGLPFSCARLGTLFRMDAVLLAPVETFRALRFRNHETGEVRRVLGEYSAQFGGYLPVGVSNLRGGTAEYVFNFGDGAMGIGHLAGYDAQEPHKPSMDPYSTIDYYIRTNVKIVRANNGNMFEKK
jgi:YD repeat-containing protein